MQQVSLKMHFILFNHPQILRFVFFKIKIPNAFDECEGIYFGMLFAR